MTAAPFTFYVFAVTVITAGLFVVVSRNPVHSVLWLILAFLSSAGMFVLLGAEFVAMLLIIVYVGVVAVLFLASPEDRTIPRQMWSGIREQISPTILAVATILVIISILLLTVVELLRRRSERLRGLSPG